jgi:hypothetical protein
MLIDLEEWKQHGPGPGSRATETNSDDGDQFREASVSELV